MTAYLAGVQERLRAAELARVEAQARAGRGARKRRRLTVALAASVLVTAGVVGGGWAYLARQRQERAALFKPALGEVEAPVRRSQAGRRRPGSVAHRPRRRPRGRAPAGRCPRRVDPKARDRARPRRDPSRRGRRERPEAAGQAGRHPQRQGRRSRRLGDRRGLRRRLPRSRDRHRRLCPRPRRGRRSKPGPPPCGWPWRPRSTTGRPCAGTSEATRLGRARLTEAARLADPDPWRNRLRELLQTSASQDRLTSLKDSPSRHGSRVARGEPPLIGSDLARHGRPDGGGGGAPRGPAAVPG